MMNNQMQNLGMNTMAWQEIRHAIILLTDGKYRLCDLASVGWETCIPVLPLTLLASVSYL